MPHLVLFEPEIPPNTGNIIRLAVNTGFVLHLVRPLGFELDHRQLRRAGLDYREWADLNLHDDFESFRNNCKFNNLYAFTTKAERLYSDAGFEPEDALLFGPESRGLPRKILGSLDGDKKLRIPMVPGSRSLNLANAVAVAAYEAWRQLGFVQAKSVYS